MRRSSHPTEELRPPRDGPRAVGHRRRTPRSLAGADRVDGARARRHAASRAGDSARAVALAREAVGSAADDLARLSPPEGGTLARHLLSAEHEHEALDEATQALADLPADASAADRAWALATHARACLVLDRDDDAHGERDGRRRRGRRRRGRARQRPTPSRRSRSSWSTTRTRRPLSSSRRAGAPGRPATSSPSSGARTTSSRRYYYAGRLDEAADALEACVRPGARVRPGVVGVRPRRTRFFDVLVRYCRGDLTPPDRLVESAPTTIASASVPYVALFDAVALYSAVARGDEDAVARGRALRSVWDRDSQVALLSGGPTIDALTWAGHLDAAVELASELIEHLDRTWDDYFLGGIWLAALALAALADGAEADRLAGVDPALKVRHGDELLDARGHDGRARPTARRPSRTGGTGLARPGTGRAQPPGRHERPCPVGRRRSRRSPTATATRRPAAGGAGPRRCSAPATGTAHASS